MEAARLFGFVVTCSRPICCLPYLRLSEPEVSNLEEVESCCILRLEDFKRLRTYAREDGCHHIAYHFPSLKHFIHRKSQTQDVAKQIACFLSLYLSVDVMCDFGFNDRFFPNSFVRSPTSLMTVSILRLKQVSFKLIYWYGWPVLRTRIDADA